MSERKWVMNVTNTDSGIFRTMNGIADEMIAIGRIIKAGFICSHVNVTNARYDAIVDVKEYQKLLRVQIKGTSTSSICFTGGSRSGEQISRVSKSRKYKYTEQDCDLIVGINSNNGDCYIIPIMDIGNWKDTITLNQLEYYKENWRILIDIAKDKK